MILVVAMTLLNIAGSTFVARVQSVVVFVVVGILTVFTVVTIVNVDWSLLAPSSYPSARHIVSSVALTSSPSLASASSPSQPKIFGTRRNS